MGVAEDGKDGFNTCLEKAVNAPLARLSQPIGGSGLRS